MPQMSPQTNCRVPEAQAALTWRTGQLLQQRLQSSNGSLIHNTVSLSVNQLEAQVDDLREDDRLSPETLLPADRHDTFSNPPCHTHDQQVVPET